MDISKILLNAGEALRPALTKIIPMKMLSRIKAGVINNAADKLSADAIIKYEHGYYKEGANVIGNVKGDNGLGQSIRIMCRLLDENNEEHVIKDFFVPPGGSRTNDTYDDRLTDKLPYDVNIIHVNASEMMVAYVSMAEPTYDRKHFGLPEDKFLFLVMYNSGSVMERKNPLAAIKAFKEAFCKDEETKKKYQNAGLVIKVAESELSADDESIINSVIDKDDNIYYMCGHVNKKEVNSLLADVDVYVSLHRSEGFGLVMAEAMYLGTPVIATNWSGNTEFMNNDTACMVGYDLIELDKDYDVFKKGNVWADAHVDEAADYMKRLYEDNVFYNKIASNGQSYAKEHLAYKRSADIVSERLKAIHSGDM